MKSSYYNPIEAAETWWNDELYQGIEQKSLMVIQPSSQLILVDKGWPKNASRESLLKGNADLVMLLEKLIHEEIYLLADEQRVDYLEEICQQLIIFIQGLSERYINNANAYFDPNLSLSFIPVECFKFIEILSQFSEEFFLSVVDPKRAGLNDNILSLAFFNDMTKSADGPFRAKLAHFLQIKQFQIPYSGRREFVKVYKTSPEEVIKGNAALILILEDISQFGTSIQKHAAQRVIKYLDGLNKTLDEDRKYEGSNSEDDYLELEKNLGINLNLQDIPIEIFGSIVILKSEFPEEFGMGLLGYTGEGDNDCGLAHNSINLACNNFFREYLSGEFNEEAESRLLALERFREEGVYDFQKLFNTSIEHLVTAQEAVPFFRKLSYIEPTEFLSSMRRLPRNEGQAFLIDCEIAKQQRERQKNKTTYKLHKLPLRNFFPKGSNWARKLLRDQEECEILNKYVSNLISTKELKVDLTGQGTGVVLTSDRIAILNSSKPCAEFFRIESGHIKLLGLFDPRSLVRESENNTGQNMVNIYLAIQKLSSLLPGIQNLLVRIDSELLRHGIVEEILRRFPNVNLTFVGILGELPTPTMLYFEPEKLSNDSSEECLTSIELLKRSDEISVGDANTFISFVGLASSSSYENLKPKSPMFKSLPHPEGYELKDGNSILCKGKKVFDKRNQDFGVIVHCAEVDGELFVLEGPRNESRTEIHTVNDFEIIEHRGFVRDITREQIVTHRFGKHRFYHNENCVLDGDKIKDMPVVFYDEDGKLLFAFQFKSGGDISNPDIVLKVVIKKGGK